MIMIYISTFYSHFGAVRFKKACDKKHIESRMMPVPRNLSSSCGTCVRFVGDDPYPAGTYPEEMEQTVLVTDNGYEVLYRAENG